MRGFIIVLPTHSDYEGVVRDFLQLLRKNWKDCPFDIVVSCTGKKIELGGVKNLYNGRNASLIDCLVNVSKKYKSDYYISFLGDSFINKEIDNSEIIKLLGDLAGNNIDYCSLKYVKEYKKEKKFNQYFRYINELDRYSHNFAAFVVSHEYLNKKLAKFEDDLDFEKYYLRKKANRYYDKRLAVRKNYFEIVSGIARGKWDTINYRKLKRDNPEIVFDDRLVLTWRESVLRHTRSFIVPHMPQNARRKIKVFVEKLFGVKFGVDG